MEDYSDWTPCEMHGHQYEESKEFPGLHVCVECGDTYEDPEDLTSSVKE